MEKFLRRKRRKYLVTSDWLWFSLAVVVVASIWMPLIEGGRSISPVQRIEAKSATEDLKPLDSLPYDELSTATKKFSEQVGGSVSVIVKPLNSTVYFEQNAETAYRAASLYKPFVAHRVLNLVDEGQLSLTRTVGEVPLSDCLAVMITRSDNDCGVALQGLIDTARTDELLDAQGYSETFLSGYYPETSARDVAALYEKIWAGDGLSIESQGLLISILEDQTIRDRLPAKLPIGTKIAHKTADLPGIVHDAGVIGEGNSAYIVVVMTENAETALAETYSAIADYSLAVYNLMNE